MARSKTPSYSVEFPLQATPEQIYQVEVRFSFLRELYNAAIAELFKRNRKLNADKKYQALVSELILSLKNKTQDSAIRKALGEMSKEYGLTEYSIQAYTTKNKNACCFKDHLDAHTIQKIASRAFDSFTKWRHKKGGKPRFKTWKRGISSAEGKNQKCLSLVLGNDKKPTLLRWKGLELPLILDKKDNQGFESSALALIEKGEWKYCRIITRKVYGKIKLYVQVIMRGNAFVKSKQRKDRELSKGQRVGLDIGPSTIAAVSLQESFLLPLSENISDKEKVIKTLQRQQARRLRLANPDNYASHQKQVGNKVKTVYKPKNGARKWHKSKAYLATEIKINDLHRNMAATRKQSHDKLANHILSMGNIILTEKISYKAWQSLFGKSIGSSAPSQLITTLKRKAENADGIVIDINTWKAKLSQYDHILNDYIKKSLNERIHYVGGKDPVQRDLYSAYLAMCIDEETHLVSRTSAEMHWSSVRQSLEAAVIHVNQMASLRALPSSLGLRRLNSELELFAPK